MWLTYAIAGTLCIGGADFGAALAGRRCTRQAEIFAVTWLQHCIALGTIAGAIALLDSGSAQPRDLLWGVAAGVALGVAKPLLYAGLSFGTISVFAPVTAVVSIGVPVGWGLGLGERPGALALAGIALAFPAVVLLGFESAAKTGRWSPACVLWLAVACGTAIGINAAALGEADAGAGLRPAGVAMLCAGVVIAAAAGWAGAVWSPPRGARPATVAAGLLDGTGFALVALALQQGLVSVAAALFALAPVVPVVLAWAVLRERLAPLHAVAIALAFAAAVLMTVG